MECDGNEACAGIDAENEASFDITNANGLKCGGENACMFSNFLLNPNLGEKIECDGDAACMFSTFSVFGGLENIVCGTDNACRDATFDVIDFEDDFKLECGGKVSFVFVFVFVFIPESPVICRRLCVRQRQFQVG